MSVYQELIWWAKQRSKSYDCKTFIDGGRKYLDVSQESEVDSDDQRAVNN